jgi:hypothetical protein
MVKILLINTSLKDVSDVIVHPQGAIFCALLTLYILLHTGTNLVCNKYVQFQLSTENSSLRMDYQVRNMLE